MNIVPAPAPRKNPIIVKTGLVPSCPSTHRPANTPIRVVTRREMPISEKRAT